MTPITLNPTQNTMHLKMLKFLVLDQKFYLIVIYHIMDDVTTSIPRKIDIQLQA